MSDALIKPICTASHLKEGGPLAWRITSSRSTYKQLSGLLDQLTAWPVKLWPFPRANVAGAFFFLICARRSKSSGDPSPAATRPSSSPRPNGQEGCPPVRPRTQLRLKWRQFQDLQPSPGKVLSRRASGVPQDFCVQM